MTSLKKEVDLLIRASVKGKRELESIPKTIKELEEGLDRQTAAAKRGESSIDQLKATLLSLDQVKSTIAGNQGLIGMFTDLNAKIAASEERVKKTAKAYEEYKVKVGNLSEATEAQNKQLDKLAKSSQRSIENLAKQRDQLASVAEQMQLSGIAADRLEHANKELIDQGARLGLVYARTNETIAQYGKTVEEARAAAARKAALDKQIDKDATDAAKRTLLVQQNIADVQQRMYQRKLSQILATREAEAKAAAAQLAADQAAKEAAARADADAKQRSINNQNAINKLILLSRAQNKAAEEQEAALNRTAAQGEKTAKSLSTLARASTNLQPKVVSLREAIGSIVAPADKTAKSIVELEKQVSDVGIKIAGTKSRVRDYAETLQALKNAQKSASDQGGLIDDFRKQSEALLRARQAFTEARQKVREYSAEVKQGGEAGQGFVKSLENAERKARAAAQALSQQLAVTRQSRESLRAAGIASNDLAGAEERLANAARSSVGSMQALTAAVEKYGIETKKAGSGGLFGGPDGERTTLNFAQRLRGQILSLTAAYVGLFGVVQLARSSIDAISSREQINNRIAVANDTNDPKVVAKEYEYLRQQADYYGASLRELANAYGSYSIAAKGRKFTDEQTKYTFEQLNSGMRVLGLNADQQNRAFTQLQQILSKVKPEAEDIKTIAESGFAGIQGLIARGLVTIGQAGVRVGHEVADMGTLMKKGLLDGGIAVYALARQVEIEFGSRIPTAIKSLSAEQGRFATSLYEFQQRIAEDGWADAYRKVLIDLRGLMQSEDGRKGAQVIADAFSGLAKALIFVLARLEDVKTVSLAFIAIWSVNRFAAAIGGLSLLRAEVTALGLAMTATQKGLILFQTAVIGFAVGSYLYNEFEIVRVGAASLVEALLIAWSRIKFGFLVMADSLPIYFQTVLAALVNSVLGASKTMGTALAQLASAVGLDGIAGALNKAIDVTTVKVGSLTDVVSKHTAALKKEQEQIRTITKENISDIKAAARPKPIINADAGDNPFLVTGSNRPGKPKSQLEDDPEKLKKAAEKRKHDIEELTKALETLNARTAKAEADSLSGKLKAVDLQYAELLRKIKELGGKEGVQFAKQFAEGITAYKDEITTNFQKKLLDEQEKLLKKVEDAEAASGRKQKDSVDLRLEAVRLKYADTYREIEAAIKVSEDNGEDTGTLRGLKARLDGAVQATNELEKQRFGQEKLNELEKVQNEILATRSKEIEAIKAQKEAGAISDVEAANRINALNQQALPTIIQAVTATREWAVANKAVFANEEQFTAYLAFLDAVIAKAKNSKKEMTDLEKTVGNLGSGAVGQGLDTVVSSLNEMAQGTKSVSQGFKDMGAALGGIFVKFLQDIAIAIIKLAIFNAMKQSGNPYVAAIGTVGAASVSVNHAGGVMGQVQNRRRMVDPAIFANAPRYHKGGIPGLAPDEYAAILQDGEEVLAKSDMRNVMNGGMTQQPATPQAMRVVLVDDQTRVPEAMASAAGEDVIVQTIKRNAPTLKQFLR